MNTNRWWQRTTTSIIPAFLILFLLLTACSTPGGIVSGGGTPPQTSHTPAAASATQPDPAKNDTCPDLSGHPTTGVDCYTPYQFRVAYGVEALMQKGFTGKGQTIVDIVSFGSPTLQQDMDAFDQQFGLPPIKIQIMNPLSSKPFDPSNKDMTGWAGETTIDVQIIHAIAPDAGIVVLTSPVWDSKACASGGRVRHFLPAAAVQKALLGAVLSLLSNAVGVPDVAGDGDRLRGVACYQHRT